MKVEIELDDEILDEIVLHELQVDYKVCSQPDYIDCSNDLIEPDQELLNALKVVIKYHSSEQEYEDWLLSIEEL